MYFGVHFGGRFEYCTPDRAIFNKIERLQAHKVHLLTTKHETGGLRTWDIPFDSELSEVTISITGENRRVKVRLRNFGKILGKMFETN